MRFGHLLLTAAIGALFFLSGAAGLMFEVLWVRLLTPLMGVGPQTTAIVIGLFMGGLALGSLLANRFPGHPLRGYGAAELAAGLWGLATPLLLALLAPVLSFAFRTGADHPLAAGVLRFAATALVVLPPTAMMGLSFPLLGRLVPSAAALLYAVNTAGAVLGCFVGGLLLLPATGLTSTRIVGSVVQLCVGLAALLLARVVPAGTPEATCTAKRARTRQRRLDTRLAASIFAWGLATMAVEIASERTLALSLGASVYSLTLVVATYIAGLAMGGAVFARIRLNDPGLGLAATGLMAGLASAAMVPLLGGLPAWMVPIVTTAAPYSYLAFLAAACVVTGGLLLPPTFVIGAGIPLGCRAVSDPERLGPLYAASTFGSITGSLAAGLILIPLAGLRGTLVLGAAGFLVASGLAASMVASRRARLTCYGSLAAAAAVLLSLPSWQPAVLTSGPFLYAAVYSRCARQLGKSIPELMTGFDKVLFHREGSVATVTVRQSADGNRSLAVNGKVDASTGLDMATQIMVGHLPMIFAPPNARVLLVGLGSGCTLGGIEKHPAASIDCLELAPEVVEACHYFDRWNGHALDDPRLSLKLVDARAYIRNSRKAYDVICNEPSNPWVSGMAGLFTREHFQACSDRLEPSGLICQWLQAYSLSVRDFRTIVKTFTSVFPEASLWEAVEGVDYMLLARKDGGPLSTSQIAAALERTEVKADLARAGMPDARALERRFVMGPSALARFGSGAYVNEDDWPLLEYTAPLSLYRDTGTEILAALEPLREGAETVLATRCPEEARRLEQLHSQRMAVCRARSLAASGRVEAAQTLLAQVLGQEPGESTALSLLKQIRSQMARAAQDAGDLPTEVRHFESYLRLAPEDVDARNDYAVALEKLGRHEAAQAEYRRVLALEPDHLAAVRNLALASYNGGHLHEAIAAYERLAVLDPKDALALNNLGICLMKDERYRDALARWRQALQVDPTLEQVRENIRILRFLGYDGSPAGGQLQDAPGPEGSVRVASTGEE